MDGISAFGSGNRTRNLVVGTSQEQRARLRGRYRNVPRDVEVLLGVELTAQAGRDVVEWTSVHHGVVPTQPSGWLRWSSQLRQQLAKGRNRRRTPAEPAEPPILACQERDGLEITSVVSVPVTMRIRKGLLAAGYPREAGDREDVDR